MTKTTTKQAPLHRIAKRALFFLTEAFALFSLIYFMIIGKTNGAAMAVVTALLAGVPLWLEKKFSCDIALPVHLFAVLYIPGPMIGNSYGLYYSTVWWDKLLHFSGGMAFAFVGLYLILLLNKKGSTSRLTRALFALFFSVTVAVAWEFVEYFADTFLGQDMQKDTFVTVINSTLLAEGGVIHRIPDIGPVTVGGEVLPAYLDIGIIDTMRDLLIETAGGLLLTAGFLLDKGRHPLVRKRPIK